MSNKIKKSNNKVNPFLLGAVVMVVIAATLVVFSPKGSNNQGSDSVSDSTGSTKTAAQADTNSTESASTADISSTETASSSETNGTETASTADANSTESASAESQAVLDENGDLVINTGDITDQVSFYEYDVAGTAVGLLAVKSSDGTIHTALNTCQVCNGSPYAYFEQKGNTIQCQNCGNTFNLDEIGQERGGCNPVPITEADKTVSDTQITISAKYLKDNASMFENWKKF